MRAQNFVAHEVKRSEEILEVSQDKNSEDSTSEIWWELVKIDGDLYVVKNSDTGQEVRLTVYADTKVIGSIKVGQAIDGSFLPNVRAMTITSFASR